MTLAGAFVLIARHITTLREKAHHGPRLALKVESFLQHRETLHLQLSKSVCCVSISIVRAP